ncbi:Serine/threonine-protein phosphatase 4 regulatory subunit 1 [Gryllus bimaculatus]|nr:Serine/threonine-protein phosphatase 4 regulatory subunit 1 [Gryllus bimaculatus]
MAENMYVPEDDGENSDEEISVKAELMEQLPHIAMVCHEEREKLHFVVEECLLPLVIRFLGDSDNQCLCYLQNAKFCVFRQNVKLEKQAFEEISPRRNDQAWENIAHNYNATTASCHTRKLPEEKCGKQLRLPFLF